MGGKCFQTTSMVASISVALLLNGCAATGGLKSVTSEQATQPPITSQQQDNAALTKIQKHSTQISRYSTVKNKPLSAQTNPLLAVGSFNFPPSVKTVGQAIDKVLSFTGYEISGIEPLAFMDMRKKPLPQTNRHLGPMPIETALLTLAGSEVFNLERDPLHRTISFKVRPSIYEKWSYDNDR